MTFLPAEKDRPHQGPWGRGKTQAWADAHPRLAVTLSLVLAISFLALAASHVVRRDEPDWLLMTPTLLFAGRWIWTAWRQFERAQNW